MYAVVKTGGKQAKVTTDAVIAVEKLDAEVGETVALPVLFIADGDLVLATPAQLEGAGVTVEVLEHFKGEKQIVFKFKKRKGYKRTRGHRQSLTSVRVVEIATSGVPAKPKAAAKPAVEKSAKPKPAAKPAKAVEKGAAKPKAEAKLAKAVEKAAPAKPATAKSAKPKPAAKPAKAVEK